MDGVSAAASFITILELSTEVVKYIRAVAGASKERKRLRDEVLGCQQIVDQLQDGIDEAENESWKETVAALKADDGPLGRLTIIFRALEVKLRPSTGLSNLKWPFKEKEIQDVLVSIEREKALLHLALLNDHRKLTQEIKKSAKEHTKLLADLVAELKRGSSENTTKLTELKNKIDRLQSQLERTRLSDEEAAILSWLTDLDFASQQNDFINLRAEGTGQWLLDSPEFRAWIETKGRTLFCPGIPGAGKTIISSIVVDTLRKSRDGNSFGTGSIGIAFVYFNFRRQNELTLDNVLLAILKQLSEPTAGRGTLPDCVASLHQYHKGKSTKPSRIEIMSTLQEVLVENYRTFLIIDALDEYGSSDGHRAKILSTLLGLQASGDINLFGTSRFIPDITSRFDNTPSLPIRASKDDVARYVVAHAEELPSFIQRDKTLQEDIVNAISSAADGMFLLAQIYLRSLDDKTTPREIRLALQRLQSNDPGASEERKLELLSQAYDQVMERIKSQRAGLANLAERTLCWITLARRPLSPSELQHALAVEVGELELHADNLTDTECIVAACAGLVTIDEEADVIRLVHYTTQEYFVHKLDSWFPDAESYVTTTCVTYLSYRKLPVFESRRDYFYKYAATNWASHGRNATLIPPGVMDFLGSESHLAGFLWFVEHNEPYDYNIRWMRKPPSPLHVVSFFGFEHAITALLDLKWPVDPTDGFGLTPLMWAARGGQEASVKLLLEKGACANKQDIYGRSPLMYAARMKNPSCVRMLLEHGADADITDNDGSTALSHAVASGKTLEIETIYVLRLLIEKCSGNIDDVRNSESRTPLSVVAEDGYKKVARFLVEECDFSGGSRDYKGNTPLSHAVQGLLGANLSIVKLFIEKYRAEGDSQNSDGRTPLLLLAAGRSHQG